MRQVNISSFAREMLNDPTNKVGRGLGRRRNGVYRAEAATNGPGRHERCHVVMFGAHQCVHPVNHGGYHQFRGAPDT